MQGRAFSDSKVDVFFQVERAAATDIEKWSLKPLDFGAGFSQARRYLDRNDANAVLVGMKQVARCNRHTADLDGVAEVHQTHIGVADAGVQTEKGELKGLDLVQIARTAACDMADATELLVDRRGHLAELGAEPRRIIEVFADRDFRSRRRGDVSQIVRQ